MNADQGTSSICVHQLKLLLLSCCWFVRAHLRQNERVVEGNLFEVVVSTGRATVPRGHVGLEHKRIRVGFERAQPRHILRRLVVHHLAVVEDRKSTRLNSSHGYLSYA